MIGPKQEPKLQMGFAQSRPREDSSNEALLGPIGAVLFAVLMTLLAGCGSGGESADSSSKTTKPAAESPAVTGVTISEESFDRDGDGKTETTHTRNPDGSLTVQIDTDGDGKPDVTRRVEALEAPPEGFDPEGIELQEVAPKDDEKKADGELR